MPQKDVDFISSWFIWFASLFSHELYEAYDSDQGEGDEILDDDDEHSQNINSDDSADAGDTETFNSDKQAGDINNNDEQVPNKNDESKKFKKPANESTASDKVSRILILTDYFILN